MKIFKTDTLYTILISVAGVSVETVEYLLPEEMFRAIFKTFIDDCHKLFPGPAREVLMLRSTISSRMYMRKRDTIYTFPESFFWNGMDTFKDAIIEGDRKRERQENDWDTLLVKNKNE